MAKGQNFDINWQFFPFHTQKWNNSYLQVKMCYKVYKEMNYNDTNTFSMKWFKSSL